MSNTYSDRKSQDLNSGLRRCRIPQRLSANTGRNKVQAAPTVKKNGDTIRVPYSRPASISMCQPTSVRNRLLSKATSPAPRSVDTSLVRNHTNLLQTRPNSAKSTKSISSTTAKNSATSHMQRTSHMARVDSPTPRSSYFKRPSSLPKYIIPSQTNKQKYQHMDHLQKQGSLIVLPVTTQIIHRSQSPTSTHERSSHRFSTQDMKRKCDELEVFNDSLDITRVLQEIIDRADDSMPNDLMELKKSWTDKLNRYEDLKKDLYDQQGTVLQLYVSLTKTHRKMSQLGDAPQLPTPDDLRIMNLSKFSPDQLAQLTRFQTPSGNCNADLIDFKQFYAAPTKLVIACERLLMKRQEIIDWLDKLKEQHGISMSKYSKKINEFNSETQVLCSSLNSIKTEFMSKLNDIVEQFRRAQNESLILQVRIEELTYEITEQRSLNQKQLQSSCQCQMKQLQSSCQCQIKTQQLQDKLEALEKELMAEKNEKGAYKESLSKAELEFKRMAEHTEKIEKMLATTQSENWNLEKTIQQLNEQNYKLQKAFDSELGNVTAAIKENTVHLEEISEARNKLQAEKEDLQIRLADLSDTYNTSMKDKEEELNETIRKLLAVQSSYQIEIENKVKLQRDHEKVCNEMLAAELKYQETLQALEGREIQVSAKEAELDQLKKQLQQVNEELEGCRNCLVAQNETITEIEHNLMNTVDLEKSLRNDIANKEEYIAELEKKDALLEQQLLEIKKTTKHLEHEVDTLKEDNETLRNSLPTENIDDLHAMIDKQSQMLYELTQEKAQLTESLTIKEAENNQYFNKVTELKNILQESSGLIEKLQHKEEELNNTIKRLENDLQTKCQTDIEIRSELAEKSNEIESLERCLDTKIQQVSELENITQALEDQLRKVTSQGKKDHEKIMKLEKTINEYETYHMEVKSNQNNSADNLDSLIKILEEELDTTYDPNHRVEEYKNKDIGDVKQDNENSEFHLVRGKTKMEVNHVKINYMIDEEPQRGDNIDRMRHRLFEKVQANTPATHAVRANGERGARPVLPSTTRNALIKNIRYLTATNRVDEKQFKMFKLAGHSLNTRLPSGTM